MIAAYFAAKDACRKLAHEGHNSSQLCVWATSENHFETYALQNSLSKISNLSVTTFPARVVRPESAQNPNLFLQQGLFTTILRDSKDNQGMPDTQELHDQLIDIASLPNTSEKIEMGNAPKFFSLRLSTNQAPRLLELLHLHGFSYNRLFEGFEGSAGMVKEEQMLKLLL